MTASYSQAFKNSGDGTRYDDVVFGAHTYGRLLTAIECKLITQRVAAEYPRGVDRALDFACGTGRILACVSGLAREAVGIEIAEPMIEVARRRVPQAEIRHQDISSDEGQPPDHFDLITSFRFFLNAEPTLRDAVMGRLAASLRDSDSRLIFNIHSSIASYNLFGAFLLGLIRIVRPATRKPVFFAHREVLALLRRHGLELVDYRTYGFLSGLGIRLIGFKRGEAIERWLAERPIPPRLGSLRLYTARAVAR